MIINKKNRFLQQWYLTNISGGADQAKTKWLSLEVDIQCGRFFFLHRSLGWGWILTLFLLISQRSINVST